MIEITEDAKLKFEYSKAKFRSDFIGSKRIIKAMNLIVNLLEPKCIPGF